MAPPGGLLAGHVHAQFGFVERISSLLTSTVMLWMVPVNLNGLALPSVTGEPGLAPQVSAPGLTTNGVVTGASVFPARVPST